MIPTSPLLDLVRLYPAFETLYNFCHCTPCNTCPLFAVCESWVFMSGHTLEQIAVEFLDSIGDVFVEEYGVEEVEA